VLGSFIAAPTSAAISYLGDGWYTLSITITAGATEVLSLYMSSNGSDALSYNGDNTKGLYVWGADVRLSADAALNIPAYQRVNTSTDYDTDGFPHYFKLNGTNQSWATASTVDFSGTDKVSLVYGVTKLSDAATAMLLETSVTSGSAAGSFALLAPSGGGAANVAYRSGGSNPASAQSTNSAVAAPITVVLTGTSNISGDSCVVRVNGVSSADSAPDQGTGNYGNYTAYTGRRAGSSFPFNGRIYSEIAVGAAINPSQLTAVERYVARRQGVSL
jgi:hypothetical protein